MHELAQCHDGGTRSCFSTAEVFFAWHFLLDILTLLDNTSDWLFAPDIRIHDAQHPRCKKKTSTYFHVRPDLPRLFQSRRIFSNWLWTLHFCFHIVCINPCFIANYTRNSFQKVFILASVIQKFVTDGSATVSDPVSEVVGQTLKLPDAFLIFKNVMTWSYQYVALFCYFLHCQMMIRMHSFTNLRNMSIYTWCWGLSQTQLIMCWLWSSLNHLNHS
jgi:hypothetical protein